MPCFQEEEGSMHAVDERHLADALVLRTLAAVKDPPVDPDPVVAKIALSGSMAEVAWEHRKRDLSAVQETFRVGPGIMLVFWRNTAGSGCCIRQQSLQTLRCRGMPGPSAGSA